MDDFKVDAAFSKGRVFKRRISNRLPLVFKAYGCFVAPNLPPIILSLASVVLSLKSRKT